MVASLADAIRCDVAYLLLNDQIQQNWGQQLSSWGWTRPSQEWWSVAISYIKQQFPDVIFLAEVYNPLQAQLQSLGFDFTYDKTLLDNLASFNLESIQSWISGNSPEFISKSMHFLSNHDEPRAVTKFGQWWLANAAALVTYTLPGMRFFWMWDNFGYTSQIDIHLRREVSESPNDSVEGFYKQLLGIVTDHHAFRNGTWSLLSVDDSNPPNELMAWHWANDLEKILCVLNFGSTDNAYGQIVLPDAEPINGNDTIPVTELLSGVTYYRSAEEMKMTGLKVLVPSWYGQIFLYN